MVLGRVQIEQAAVGLAQQLLEERFGIVAEEVGAEDMEDEEDASVEEAAAHGAGVSPD